MKSQKVNHRVLETYQIQFSEKQLQQCLNRIFLEFSLN